MQLDAAWLQPTNVYRLPMAPTRVAIAAEGHDAYAILPRDGAPPVAGTAPTVRAATTILHINVDTGSARRLAELPGVALDLAAATSGVYVLHSSDDQVWLLDRRTGRLARNIRVGRHPTGILLAGNA